MSFGSVLFTLTALAYTVACVLFFVHLSRGNRESARGAARALGVAMVGHAAYLGSELIAGRSLWMGIHEVMTAMSLVITLAYLLTMRRHRLTVLGAFITPITLLLLLAAGLRSSVPPVPDAVRSALLPVHIGVNVLGMAAFALAFAVAVAYLIQEQLLRSKNVLGVFQRLPALDVLDSLGAKLLTLGFPLFTIGLVIGTFWAARGGAMLSAGQAFGMVAWLFFGSVLLARVVAGWSGRRAAIGTMLGFLCALVALGGYVVRGMHAG
jgi:ABC-type uncharacterized transport system permease subunit